MKRQRATAAFISNGGVKVYAPANNAYWRITWLENGTPKDTTAKDESAALVKAAEIDQRLAVEGGERSTLAANFMIDAWLEPETRMVTGNRWGDKHAYNQQAVMDLYVRPVIGKVTCSRLTNKQVLSVVRGTPTHSVAKHVSIAVKSLIHWGASEGWIIQPTEHLLKGITNVVGAKPGNKKTKQSGETNEYIDPKRIPDHKAVAKLGKMMAKVTGVWWFELIVNLAAYSGVRLGEALDLDVDDIDLIKHQIRIDYQCLEVNGKKTRSLPKGDKQRRTVYPLVTPIGYDLQAALKKRVKELQRKDARMVQDGKARRLLFPSDGGGWMTHGTFGGQIRRPAQELAGWPKDEKGRFLWNFHSLRHTFCSYFLFDLKKDPRDVSIAAGHTSVSTTMNMYVGAAEGALGRLND